MDLEFDPHKRAITLANRGLDFAEVAQLFAGRTATIPDDREEYGESRFITAGTLNGRLVVVVGPRAVRPAASFQ